MKCQCKFCKKIFNVDEKHLGKNVNCPNCKNMITIQEYVELEAIELIPVETNESKLTEEEHFILTPDENDIVLPEDNPKGNTKKQLTPWQCFWYNVTKNYCNFEGRVGRREFWFFQLFAFLSGFCAGIITFPFSGFLGWVLTLVLFLPHLGITIRRFHDINQSASFVISLFVLSLIAFIPTIGILGGIPGIIVIIFSCIKGNTQTNRYGEPPQA